MQAKPVEIQVDELPGPIPTPSGGSIADGIYDLVAEQEYQAPSLSDVYVRGAIRFFDAGTHVEHIYDPVLGSQADDNSPHRLMNVSSDGSELTFDVTCPDRSSVTFPHYLRGYTASGSELWLFQQQLIEIYMKRP